MDSNFSQKFFQKFFYEYVIFGIDPPFSPDNMSYKGAYGRGEGVILVDPPMVGVCQTLLVPHVTHCHVDNLINNYSGVNNF
jgi:hypothetical protein